MKTLFGMSLAGALAFGALSAPAAAQQEISFGIIATDSASTQRERWEPFFRDMEKKTGIKVTSFYAPDYAGVIEAMRFNKIQVAWYGNKAAMEDIIGLVTEHFGVKLSELQSKKRTNAIAYPRQVAMYLARQITRHSLEEIGGFFGGRDHSTVIYAVDKVKELAQTDESCRRLIDEFLHQLRAPSS